MMILQVAYEIPPNIMAGLLSGELTRFGSVVRDYQEIIAHLKEVPLPVDNQEAVMARIAEALKNPKAIIGISLGVIVVGGIAFLAVKKHKQKLNTKPELPKCVENYIASLGAYLEAIRTESVDADVIDRLISDLDAVRENSIRGEMFTEFSTEQADTLVSLVADYTRKLADANSVELSELQEPAPDATDNSIIDMRRYLAVQKQIFKKAA